MTACELVHSVLEIFRELDTALLLRERCTRNQYDHSAPSMVIGHHHQP